MPPAYADEHDPTMEPGHFLGERWYLRIMTSRPTRVLLATCAVAALLLLGAGGAACWAHDFLLEPDHFHADPGAIVTMRFFLGHGSERQERGRSGDHIQRFVCVTPDGVAHVPGNSDGAGGALRLEEPGVYMFAYQSRPAVSAVAPAAFRTFLKEAGLEGHEADRAVAARGLMPVRIRTVRCAKSLVRVGTSVRGDAGASAGLALELAPQTKPAAMVPGVLAAFKATKGGQSLVGALVVAALRDSPSTRVAARTDSLGRVHLRIVKPGAWVVMCSTVQRSASRKLADWDVHSASLTFDVARPAAASADESATPKGAEPKAKVSK